MISDDEESRARGARMWERSWRAREISRAKDVPSVLEAVRAVPEPFERAMALVNLAETADADVARVFLTEARTATWSADDPYQIVAYAWFWLQCAIHRGMSEVFLGDVPRLLEASTKIDNVGNRVRALVFLLTAVAPVDTARRQVVDAIVSTPATPPSWRAGQSRRDAVLLLAADHRDEAERILTAMPEDKYRRQARERLRLGGGQ